ncbi:MAG: hypothetical protein A3K19_29100 [Lentisphaerae bacterium RIFOXYB12_FULL_65_16]|nr:MAG: hypothetical protein A3K18_04490 [Lentisphaerae bacterium RIFOXYA12_64_32]OGV88356.1 MAG: hypothetical protein A3K19_29100 [Lentisphaerae bacterium RIFOXYB12_FULL_65_16]
MISKELLDILACPACETRPPVRLTTDGQALACDTCGRHYPIRDDIPIMLVDEATIPAESTKNKAS